MTGAQAPAGAAERRRGVWVAFFALLGVGVLWGANLPITGVLLKSVDPWFQVASRIALAAATLAAIVAAVEGPAALRPALSPLRFAEVGLLMGSFFALYTLSIQLSDPITVAALLVTQPLVAAATARVVAGHRYERGFAVALVLSLLGGAITVWGREGGQEWRFRGGEILVPLSVVCWTVYSLRVQAWFGAASQLRRSYVGTLSAALWLAALYLAMRVAGVAPAPGPAALQWDVIGGIVFVAVLSTGLGGTLWNVGVSRVGVSIASLWGNLVPVFGVLIAVWFGFPLGPWQIVGGLVAMAGVLWMQMRQVRG